MNSAAMDDTRKKVFAYLQRRTNAVSLDRICVGTKLDAGAVMPVLIALDKEFKLVTNTYGNNQVYKLNRMGPRFGANTGRLQT